MRMTSLREIHPGVVEITNDEGSIPMWMEIRRFRAGCLRGASASSKTLYIASMILSWNIQDGKP